MVVTAVLIIGIFTSGLKSLIDFCNYFIISCCPGFCSYKL